MMRPLEGDGSGEVVKHHRQAPTRDLSQGLLAALQLTDIQCHRMSQCGQQIGYAFNSNVVCS